MIIDVACHYTHGSDVADAEWVMIVMTRQKPTEMTMLPLLKPDKSKINIIPPSPSSSSAFSKIYIQSLFVFFLHKRPKNATPNTGRVIQNEIFATSTTQTDLTTISEFVGGFEFDGGAGECFAVGEFVELQYVDSFIRIPHSHSQLNSNFSLFPFTSIDSCFQFVLVSLNFLFRFMYLLTGEMEKALGCLKTDVCLYQENKINKKPNQRF